MTNADSVATVIQLVVAYPLPDTAPSAMNEKVTVDGVEVSLGAIMIMAPPELSTHAVSGESTVLGPTSFLPGNPFLSIILHFCMYTCRIWCGDKKPGDATQHGGGQGCLPHGLARL